MIPQTEAEPKMQRMLDDNQKLENLTVVIVGFQVHTENSVFYKKMNNPSDRDLGCAINKALRENKCDFLSIRSVSRGE